MLSCFFAFFLWWLEGEESTVFSCAERRLQKPSIACVPFA